MCGWWGSGYGDADVIGDCGWVMHGQEFNHEIHEQHGKEFCLIAPSLLKRRLAWFVGINNGQRIASTSIKDVGEGKKIDVGSEHGK